ncbi:MAG: tRNA(Ile)-lysidine synthase [Methanoregulaceae archaeon]|nr:tRNA(Ile)-lysidine synthase [Methanoregulaceae archaeon]
MPSLSCDRCSETPVLFQRYSGRHLCADHFLRDFESRAKRTIREHGWLLPGNTIAVALSGKTTGTALLHFLHDLVGRRKDIRFFAITLDEDMGGFRDCRGATRIAESLGYRCITTTCEDTSGISETDRSDCTDPAPGSSRQERPVRLLETVAKRNGADIIAWDSTLDDCARAILAQILQGKPVPCSIRGPGEKQIIRMMPFMSIPGREVALYIHLKIRGLDPIGRTHEHDLFLDDVNILLERYAWNHPAAKFALARLGEELSSDKDHNLKGDQVNRCDSPGNTDLNSFRSDDKGPS